MPDRQREQPSFGAGMTGQLSRKLAMGAASECGRHHDDAKPWAEGRPKALQQREGEVTVDVALVELVEHNGVDVS